jgi:heme A synthase
MISKDILFALSLFPYLAFLWFLARSKQAPPLAMAGFYFTLVFVGVTIPAGIYTKVVYGESLANVDWLHGTAESFLTLSNILIVLGFRQSLLRCRSIHRA